MNAEPKRISLFTCCSKTQKNKGSKSIFSVTPPSLDTIGTRQLDKGSKSIFSVTPPSLDTIGTKNGNGYINWHLPHLFFVSVLEGKQQSVAMWIQIHCFDAANLSTWRAGDILGYVQCLSFVAKPVHFPKEKIKFHSRSYSVKITFS